MNTNSNLAFFCEHLRNVLKRYASFKGSSSHQEFWTWAAFAGLIIGALFMLAFFLEKPAVAYVLYAVSALLFFPTLAVTVRRLHDTGHSGWWILLWGFILIGTALFGFLSGYLLQGMSPGDTVSTLVNVSFPIVLILAGGYSLLMLFWLASPGKARG